MVIQRYEVTFLKRLFNVPVPTGSVQHDTNAVTKSNRLCDLNLIMIYHSNYKIIIIKSSRDTDSDFLIKFWFPLIKASEH